MAANRKSATGGKTKSAGGAKGSKKAKSWQMYCPGSEPGSGSIVTCHAPQTRSGCCKRAAETEEQ